MEFEKVKSEETKDKFYSVATIGSAMLLFASILGLAVNALPVFHGLVVLFTVSTVVFAWLKFSFTQKKAHLSVVFENVEQLRTTADKRLCCASPKLTLVTSFIRKMLSKMANIRRG